MLISRVFPSSYHATKIQTTSAPSVAEDELDLSDDSGAESLGSLGVMGSCAFAVIVALVWSF